MMICSHFVAEGDEVQGDQKVGDSLNVLHTHTKTNLFSSRLSLLSPQFNSFN